MSFPRSVFWEFNWLTGRRGKLWARDKSDEPSRETCYCILFENYCRIICWFRNCVSINSRELKFSLKMKVNSALWRYPVCSGQKKAGNPRPESQIQWGRGCSVEKAERCWLASFLELGDEDHWSVTQLSVSWGHFGCSAPAACWDCANSTTRQPSS